MVEIFRKISYEEYRHDHGVVTSLRNVSSTKAYHLKGGIGWEVDLDKVNPGVVAVKCIELRLDYEIVMERLPFQAVCMPERGSKDEARLAHMKQVSEDGSAWTDYLLTERRRQMNIEDPRIWPRRCPLLIEDVLSMPVVAWISISKQK